MADLSSICPDQEIQPYLELLASALPASLSAENHIRLDAENLIKSAAASKNPAFPLAMDIILLDESVPVHLRHLSGVLLRQYISELWKVTDGEAIKEAIKTSLLQGLALVTSTKLNIVMCMCIAELACVEWPEHWPDLIVWLSQLPCTEDGTSTGDQGNQSTAYLSPSATRCLLLFVESISAEKAPLLMEAAYPHILTLLQAQGQPTAARYCAAKIVGHLMKLFGESSADGIQGLSQALEAFVPQWVVISTQLIEEQIMSQNCNDGYGIAIEILLSMNTVVTFFPSLCFGLEAFLGKVLTLFGSIEQDFLARIKNSCTDEEPLSLDGDRVGLSSLIGHILEFLCTITESPLSKIYQLMSETLGEVFALMLKYMQLTDSQIELWENDPNEFFVEEEDDLKGLSIRQSSLYLIMVLTEVFPKEAFDQLFSAIDTHLNLAISSEIDPNSWHPWEACFLAFGSMAQAFLHQLQKLEKTGLTKEEASDSLGFPLEVFKLQLLSALNSSASLGLHLLQSQVSSVAVKYLGVFSPEECGELFLLCMENLDPSMPVPLRLCGCKMLAKLIGSLHQETEVHHEVHTTVARAASLVFELVFHSSESTINIMVESLIVLIQFSPQVIHALGELGIELDQVTYSLWEHYPRDSLLVPIGTDLLQNIFSSGYYSIECVKRLISYLESIALGQFPKLHPAITEGCLHNLAKFVQTTFRLQSEQNFGEEIQKGISSVLLILHNTDDTSITQAGNQALKVCVQGLGAGSTLRDLQPKGTVSIVQQIFEHLSKVLAPSTPDEAAIFAGDIVLAMILNLSDAMSQEDVASLLSILVNKLLTSRTRMLSYQLVMIFVRLIVIDADSICDFLLNWRLQGPLEGTGMDLLICQWLRLHQDINGEYLAKMSCVGMIQLLSYILQQKLLETSLFNSQLTLVGPLLTDNKMKAQTNTQLVGYEGQHLLAVLITVLTQTASDLEQTGLKPDLDVSESDMDSMEQENPAQEESLGYIDLGCFDVLDAPEEHLSSFILSEELLYDDLEMQNNTIQDIDIKIAIAELLVKERESIGNYLPNLAVDTRNTLALLSGASMQLS